MTAHPLALIAGQSDGIDPEQRDQIDDHMTSCDTCRTYARAIERVDRLITSPEPSLALPPRAAAERPRGHATTVLATIAAAVLLVIVASVVRQSFQQTAAARPAWADMVAQGNDACDLVPAGRTVYVKELPTQPFPAVPAPFRTFGFEGRCGYGFREGWFEFHLLMDAEPVARGEVLAWWSEFLRDQDCSTPGSVCPPATLRSWSTSDTPSPGGVAAVRRWTTGVTAGHQWSMMGVWAESYYFVVTAETTDRASQFADAVIDQLKQRPWPPDAWRSNACMVIDRAAVRGGLAAGSGAQPTDLLRYGSTSAVFENVCAYSWQYGPNNRNWWEAPNLFLRTGTTTPDDVQRLLRARPLDLPGAAIPRLEPIDEWTLIDDGIWLSHAETQDDRRWSAVAGLSGSQFFVVTFDSDDKAIRLARAIAAELKR